MLPTQSTDRLLVRTCLHPLGFVFEKAPAGLVSDKLHLQHGGGSGNHGGISGPAFVDFCLFLLRIESDTCVDQLRSLYGSLVPMWGRGYRPKWPTARMEFPC